jgi:hypothetical protein
MLKLIRISKSSDLDATNEAAHEKHKDTGQLSCHGMHIHPS